MTEEQLTIIIKAINDQAKGKIKEISDELKKAEKQAEETEKAMDETMGAIKKGAAIALASITALVAGMNSLGKSAMENQKNISKLTASFQASGSSASQALASYTGLFRIMGDTQAATEAAQSLARLTNAEQEQIDMMKVAMGIYAIYGDGMPIESIMESAAETASAGQITGELSRALVEAGISEEAFNASLQACNSEQERASLIVSTLLGLYGGAAELYEKNNGAALAYNESQVKLQITLANLTKALTPMMTALSNTATVLLTALKPAIETVAAAIIVFCQWIGTAVSWIASLFGIDMSSSNDVADSTQGIATGLTQAQGAAGGLNDTLSDAANSAKELKKQTMGFDELNVISSPSSSGSGGGGGGGGSKLDLSGLDTSGITAPLDDFKNKIEEVREKMKGILVLVGLVGAGLIAWKIADFIQGLKNGTLHMETLTSKLKLIGGWMLIIAGALLLVKGYSDAWANGLDWENFSLTLSGIALIVGGLFLAFGRLAGAIGIVAGGIAMLVLGVKDFIDNGASLQNTILIIGGAIAVAVGLATGGLSVVASAIIGVVAAVGAFTAAILLEKPAIMTTEEAQNNLTAAKERAAAAENSYVYAVDAAEAAMNRLAAAEEAAGMTGEELYKQVQEGTIDYQNMDATQRELYKAYLDNEQKQRDLAASTEELEKAKKAETIASFENQLALAKESGNYEDYKKSVVEAFESGELSAEEARDLIEKAMSEMSDASQDTFTKDLPGDIKDGLDPHKYESAGTKIKKWFSNLWTGIKNVFSDVKTWFAEIGTKIGTALSNAASSAINWLLEKAINMINGFINSINWAIGIINKIPGVNITKLNKLEVPKLATGGIATRSILANIGENGREAVLPLENNTGWMDTLADRIASRNNTPSKVVLMVGEKELGYAAINSINGITRQTGELPLKLY